MTAPHAPLEIREHDFPVLPPGGILLETLASEVCGTDVHLHEGRLDSVPWPIIPGHVSCGRVVQAAGAPKDPFGEEIRAGDVVTFYDVYGQCGSCYSCLVAKQETRCPHRRVYGITTRATEGLLGGWATHIELRPGVRTVKLKGGVTVADFMGGGCGLPTGFSAVERGGVVFGDTVVVQGAGPVGQSAAIFAKLCGAGRVVMIGGPANRIAAARARGVDEAIDIEAVTEASERRRIVLDQTGGRGADLVIEATGNPAAVREALELVRDGGRVVVVGQYTDAGDITISPHRHLNRKHVTLLGSWGYEFRHLYLSMGGLERTRERYDWAGFVTREYALSETTQALGDMKTQSVLKALVRPATF
ncbi:MAG: zinc-binding dehydrogenase [Vicinamibacteria bacterium]|nr:zinc-binding dehydrogenase [Vicinamibacteria bacterium]